MLPFFWMQVVGLGLQMLLVVLVVVLVLMVVYVMVVLGGHGMWLGGMEVVGVGCALEER